MSQSPVPVGPAEVSVRKLGEAELAKRRPRRRPLPSAAGCSGPHTPGTNGRASRRTGTSLKGTRLALTWAAQRVCELPSRRGPVEDGARSLRKLKELSGDSPCPLHCGRDRCSGFSHWTPSDVLFKLHVQDQHALLTCVYVCGSTGHAAQVRQTCL